MQTSFTRTDCVEMADLPPEVEIVIDLNSKCLNPNGNMRTVEDILNLIKFNTTDDATLSDLKWKAIFVDFFIEENEDGEADDEEGDDLLFFVSRPVNNRRERPNLEVRRKFATNLPLDSPWINWEESLYLNLLLQKLRYSIIFSITTRTGGDEHQFLSKTMVPVYATPSQHSVVYKQSNEAYSYPLINFNIENFEDFIYENILNDLESIYLELIVHVSPLSEPIVLHSASVNYGSIDYAYHKKKLFSNHQMHKYFGLLQVESSESEGSTEVVVKKKIKRSISESSNGSIIDSEEDESSQMVSLQLYLINLNRLRPKDNCYYSTNNLTHIDLASTVYTIDNEDCFATDDTVSKFWAEPGFRQAYFDWKARQKRESNSFHVFVSNICLPWNHIIARLISNKSRSMFTL